MTDFMKGMSVCHLRFTVQAKEAIILYGQPGSALRGALYEVLSEHFCSEKEGSFTDNHTERCPVCWLLAFEDPLNHRGANVPRPLTIQPPEARTYHADETFIFGLSLIGEAQNLLPYLVRGVSKMGSVGIGQGRGRFQLKSVTEYSPLFDAERTLITRQSVQAPTLQVTDAQINEVKNSTLTRITLEFITPTRLISEGKLIKRPEPQVFMARLLERCQQLAGYYSETDHIISNDDWKMLYQLLTAQAASWHIAYDDTQWVEAFSGSKRRGRMTPISGFAGVVRWEGELGEAHRWLLWGQSLHVGKDAVKGNGWYRIVG